VIPHASFERLQAVKAAYDPDGTIISAHPVRPAALPGADWVPKRP
jgi:hypothetical protein